MYFQVRLSIHGENLEKPIFQILLTFANVGTYIGLLANVGAWVSVWQFHLSILHIVLKEPQDIL